MDIEKMNGRELTEKELEMVSGGVRTDCRTTCSYRTNPSACPTYSSCPYAPTITPTTTPPTTTHQINS